MYMWSKDKVNADIKEIYHCQRCGLPTSPSTAGQVSHFHI